MEAVSSIHLWRDRQFDFGFCEECLFSQLFIRASILIVIILWALVKMPPRAWSLTTKQVEARPARRLYVVVIPAFIHSQRYRIEPRRHRGFIQLFNRRHFSTRGQP